MSESVIKNEIDTEVDTSIPMAPLEPTTKHMMVMGVETTLINTIQIKIVYNNNTEVKEIIKLGDIATITYVNNSKLCKFTGRVYDFNQSSISIDCSYEFKANTIKILTANIRGIEILRDRII